MISYASEPGPVGEMFLGTLAVRLVLLATVATAMWAQQAAPEFRTAPARAHYQKGVELGDKGLWAPAIVEFSQALAAEPGNPQILMELGIAQAERKEWRAALAALRKAVAVAPRSVRAHYSLGLTLDRSDPGKGAGIAEYRKALELEPRHVDALVNLAIDVGERNPAEAKALFARAIQLAPKNASAHLNFALLLRRENEEETSLGEFRQAIRLDPSLVEARRQLVAMLMPRQQTGEVIEQCREILQREPDDAGTKYTLGQALVRSGKVEEGRVVLAEAQGMRKAAQQRKQSQGLQAQGLRELDAGRFAPAAAAFGAAVPLDDSSANHMYLGLALAGSGDWKAAIRELTTAIERDPRNARAHLNLGAVYLQAGQEPQGQAEVRKALEMDPWFPEAHNNLGLILAKDNHPEKALEHFRLAADLSPQYLEAIFNLGLTYHALGRLDEATATFRRAAEVAPQNARVQYALGMTLKERGDAAGAQVALDQAARLERQHP